jgi:hypothetical protein
MDIGLDRERGFRLDESIMFNVMSTLFFLFSSKEVCLDTPLYT